MTLLEVRALLARCDPRQLREDSGISLSTVAAAFGVRAGTVASWERDGKVPQSTAGYRWAAFISALERRSWVTALIELEEREAA